MEKALVTKKDDELRAEGIAINNNDQLFLEQGTIIHVMRDFKALDLKGIFQEHEAER
jgi:hypothetical protein